MKISIIGAGTWGTALANAFIVKHEVTVWSRFQEEVDAMSKTRKHKNLPGAVLSDKIKFTASIEEACKDKDIVVFAVPSPYVRETAMLAKPYLNDKQIIVDVAKGIEEDTLLTISEVINDVLGMNFDVVVLSGPTHAEEVSIGLPTTIVAASENKKVAKIVQQQLSLPYFRIYVNGDTKGVELAAAFKNIIALAAGMSDGLGYGDNAKAAIITRGLVEISRLGMALGCSERTFSGLAGIGDIVVTATSKHSRNHNAGALLGSGVPLKETLEQVGMVVEGINCLKAAKQLALKTNVEMPIIKGVYDIVFNGLKPVDAVNALVGRELISE